MTSAARRLQHISAIEVAAEWVPLCSGNGLPTGLPASLPVGEANDARAVLDGWMRWLDGLTHEGAAR